MRNQAVSPPRLGRGNAMVTRLCSCVKRAGSLSAETAVTDMPRRPVADLLSRSKKTAVMPGAVNRTVMVASPEISSVESLSVTAHA